jgi:tetratricopeptide (TPR) repeat protein
MDREDQLIARAERFESQGSDWYADGRFEQAAGDFEQAAAIYRQLMAGDPTRFALRLAAEINNVGLAWSKLGRHEEAVGALTEAIQLAGPYDDQPEVLPFLGGVTSSLAGALAELGQQAEAMAISERAVLFRRSVLPAGELIIDADLARTLRLYARLRASAGVELDRAQSTIGEAVAIYQELAAADPAEFEPELFASYAVMAEVLDRTGRREEAVAIRNFLADKLY